MFHLSRKSPSYTRYVQLLLQLHQTMKEGKSESEEADRIRDAMDKPWTYLTEDERNLADAISADLYALEPDSPLLHSDEFGAYDPGLAEQIEKAKRRCDPMEVLRLLRENPTSISSDLASMIRGAQYASLGELDVASLFYREANRLVTHYLKQKSATLAASG